VIAYVDSSVFIRALLREPTALPEWQTITLALTSALLRVECCRTLDRYVHNGTMAESDYAAKIVQIDEFVDNALVAALDKPLLLAASRHLPVRLATLDAIHLAAAERFRDRFGLRKPFIFATHDRELAAAARSLGFEVIGAN
jgi:predicted nucleic acid-binding protein